MAEPWYIQQRAESLAMVLLTREPHVRVARGRGSDFGIDFTLSLNPDDADDWVGVLLRAVSSDPAAAVPSIRPELAGRYYARLNVPLFLMVVNASVDGHCWFSWVKEPVWTDGEPRLQSHVGQAELTLAPLTPDAYRHVQGQCRAYFHDLRGAPVG